MFALQCPKCHSSRIHRGYNRPSLIKRLLGRKSLLCNNCNLLFEGFALDSKLEKAKKRRRKRWTPTDEHEHDSRPPISAATPGNELAQEERAEDFFDDDSLDDFASQSARVQREGDSLPDLSMETTNLEDSSEIHAAARADYSAAPVKEREFVTPSSLAPADDLQPTKWDYFKFARYYAKLRLKSLFRMHSSSHPMDISFRWRNWWHWQRRKRLGI